MPMNIEPTPFSVQGRIAKVDDNQLVFGWASIIKTAGGLLVLDKEKDFCQVPWELEKSAYQYVISSGNASDTHLLKGVGTVVESVVFTPEKTKAMGIADGVLPIGWWVGFKVNDENVWGLVKSGRYTSFSIGGRGKRTPVSIDDTAGYQLPDYYVDRKTA